ncbi:siderophore-interacting protein [Paracidovorax konjaci]|uniref:NADPH-dependent ferric siderophore reductase, contains FAD-binding and SIP domains n=1 Tax=Paracidovorax konjaci TaxID=32040 RepID=A0A1I1XHX1_9BURK|nr:siderophore-interacting protein [Paracidovorax konjaci]SFE06791.1 NADPH-dependent ferric siderophore reductase, contains FAD-binding and SIP domains [Paracidovorax konjaci]
MTSHPSPATPQPTPEQLEARAPQRVRHELRLRTLTVQRAERITPHCVRVTLAGDDLAGFHSPGFDDHVKLLLPDPATGELVLPSFGAQGAAPAPDAPRPTMRDYTPRHHDAQAGTLAIDFAVHDAGPATAWALQAAPGQRIGIGGPRGSLLVPLVFDGYVLIGDDTALPAIGRRLAELPAGAPALVLIEVDGPADEQGLPTQAAARIHWVHRAGTPAGEGSGLLGALRTLALPAGDVHAWVGCETTVAKALRAHLVGERGVHPKWIKAAGYWRRGSADTHETIED